MRVLILTLACLGLVGACRPSDPPPAPTPPSTRADQASPVESTPGSDNGRQTSQTEAEATLVFLRQRQLTALQPGTGEVTRLGLAPSTDAALAPDGAEFVAVRDTSGMESDDGYIEPELLGGDLEDPDDVANLGPGRAPTWAPEGDRFAAIVPVDGAEEIWIYPVPFGDPLTTEAARDRWALVGWHGDEVIAIGSSAGVVAIDVESGKVRPLALPPSELWGVSPSDRGTLISVRKEQVLLESDGRTRSLELGEGVIADGSWSWDGSTVAAVMLDRSRSRLVLIDVGTGEVQEVTEGNLAQGNVVWSADDETFAFVRVDPEDRQRLQVVVCRGPSGCEPGFSWVRGVTLLGFSS